MRLPLYHCDFNAIELIWEQIKEDVAKHNILCKSSDVKALFQKAVSKVMVENWKNACAHVQKVEQYYWEKDGLMDKVLDRFVINLDDLDSEWSEDDKDYEEDGSTIATSSDHIPGVFPLPPTP